MSNAVSSNPKLAPTKELASQVVFYLRPGQRVNLTRRIPEGDQVVARYTNVQGNQIANVLRINGGDEEVFDIRAGQTTNDSFQKMNPLIIANITDTREPTPLVRLIVEWEE